MNEESPELPWERAKRLFAEWVESRARDRDGPSLTTIALHQKYKAAREHARAVAPKAAP